MGSLCLYHPVASRVVCVSKAKRLVCPKRRLRRPLLQKKHPQQKSQQPKKHQQMTRTQSGRSLRKLKGFTRLARVRMSRSRSNSTKATSYRHQRSLGSKANGISSPKEIDTSLSPITAIYAIS